MALPPLPDIFGNYAVANLEHLVEPEAISLWPSAPGWRVLLALAFIWLGVRAWRRWQKWRRNRYRREALTLLLEYRDLPTDEVVQALARLLKSTALAAFPRTEIASLSGAQWLDWLEQHGATFSADSRSLLAGAQYQAAPAPDTEVLECLIRDTERWVRSHPEAA